MRERLVVGNWKMYTNLADAVVLATRIRDGVGSLPGDVTVVICPPTVWLYPIAEIFERSADHLTLGAQNVWPGKEGRFTGEVSAWMLAQMCQFAIIGHSERRVHQGEDHRLINQKVKAALATGLRVILCVGEFRRLGDDRGGQLKARRGDTANDLFGQLRDALAGVAAADFERVVVAYEPVWAIGANHPAEPAYIDRVIRQLRTTVNDYTNSKRGAAMTMLYGGSVSDRVAAQLVHSSEVDGVLVGTESVNAKQFLAIAAEWHTRRKS